MSIPDASPGTCRTRRIGHTLGMLYHSRRSRGLSLIELLIFILIISVAVVAILRVQAQASLMSADPQLQKQALVIAESLLEEISLAKFTYCDPTDANADSATSAAQCTTPEVAGQETGNPAAPDCSLPNRVGGAERTLDNVSDYVTTFGVPMTYLTDALGACFPIGYTATVTIAPDANLGPAGAQITPADATPANLNVLRITVSVTHPRGVVTLDGYRTRYAPNSLP